MKSTQIYRLITKWSLIGLLTTVPFYAFITVWGSSITGGYTAWRLFPEVLLLLASLLAVRELVVNELLIKKLRQDKLFIALLCYIVVIITWSIGGLLFGKTNLTAAAQGLVMDARLPISLLTAWILTPKLNFNTRQLWRWILTPAVIVLIFGWLQATILPNNFLSHFGYSTDTISATETVDQKDGYVRVQSTLRGANPLGAYLVIVTALSFAGLLAYPKYRLVFGGVSLLAVMVLFFTYSRSAYIGAIMATLMVTWFSIKKLKFKRWLMIGAAGLLVLSTGLVYIYRDNDHLQNILFHTDENSTSSLSSNDQRGSALKSGLEDVLSNPVGEGVGTAGPASLNNDQPGRIAENYYLQLGQEIGWVGLSLFVMINLLIAHRLWVAKKKPIVLAMLAALVGITLVNMLSHAWTDVTLAYVWWLGAGLLLGSDIMSQEGKNKNGKKVNQVTRS